MFIRLSLFQKIFKLVGIGLIKQRKLDADPTAIQEINFTGDQDRVEGSTMFFIIEKAKETVSDFSKQAVTVL